MSEEQIKKTVPTLCWDCAKATGKCSWSSSLEPVEGWKAIPTRKEKRDYTITSCIVFECPQFERDALSGGLYRLDEKGML